MALKCIYESRSISVKSAPFSAKMRCRKKNGRDGSNAFSVKRKIHFWVVDQLLIKWLQLLNKPWHHQGSKHLALNSLKPFAEGWLQKTSQTARMPHELTSTNLLDCKSISRETPQKSWIKLSEMFEAVNRKWWADQKKIQWWDWEKLVHCKRAAVVCQNYL